MEGAGFVVAFSSFMDETTALADLVLPEHTYLEDWGDDIPDPAPGYQVIGLQQPVVSPFHDGTRGFGDELLVLGRALGLDLDSRLGLANVTDPSMQDLLRRGQTSLWQMDRGSVRASSFDGFWNGVLQRGGWWDTAVIDNSGVRNFISWTRRGRHLLQRRAGRAVLQPYPVRVPTPLGMGTWPTCRGSRQRRTQSRR